MILANLPSSPNAVIACLIAGTVFLTVWMICKICALCSIVFYSKAETTAPEGGQQDVATLLKSHQEDRSSMQAISIVGTLCFVCSVILYVCGGQITLEEKSGTTRVVFDPLPITIEVAPQKTPPR